MSAFKKALKILGHLQWYLGVLCLFAIVVTITIGVVSRKVFNNPLSWVEELCTLLFIYLAFFGASVAAMNRKHVSADFLTSKLSPSGHKKLFLIQRVVILVLLAFMVVSSIILFPKMGGHSSTNLDVPKSIYYLPIMFSSIYMFLAYLDEIIDALRAKTEEDDK